MKNKMPYSVSEGYFEDLGARLREIPSEGGRRRMPVWKPAVAAMAAFALMVGVCTPYLAEQSSVRSSEDEIIEYLIDSGLTLAQLEEYVSNI